MLRMIFFIAFFLFISNIQAFSPFQLEPIDDEEGIEVEQKEFCFLEEETSQYLKEEDFFMPNVDYDDYIVEIGQWQTEVDANKEYQTKIEHYYQLIDKIRYIHILKTQSPDNQFMINEVIIGNKGEEIDYSVSCINCPNNLYNQVKNGNFYNEGFYIIGEAELIFDLGNYYELEDIDVNLFISNYVHGENRYTIHSTKDKTNVFSRVIMRIWFSNPIHEFRWYQSNMLNDAGIYEPSYLSKVQTDTLLESTKTMKTFSETYYREINYLYKNYDYILHEVPKEESDYCQIMYRYREIVYEEEIVVKEESEVNGEENSGDKEEITNKIYIDQKTDKILKIETKEEMVNNEELRKETDQDFVKENNNDKNNREENQSKNKIPYLVLLIILLIILVVRKYVKY